MGNNKSKNAKTITIATLACFAVIVLLSAMITLLSKKPVDR